MPAAPAASCAFGSGRTHTSNNEYTGITRHSLTQWFYDLLRALPGDRAFLPPSPADMFCLSPVGPTQLRKLDASVGASGPHDFAVRNNISRPRAVDRSQVFRPALASPRAQNAAASTASRPAFRDDHDTPLFRGGMRKVLDVIWGERKQEYFCKQDWTGNAPDGQISPVGWVEPFAKPIIFANLQLMGIASLHPSYGPGSAPFSGGDDLGWGAGVLAPPLC